MDARGLATPLATVSYGGMEFSSKLKILRERGGMSQEALAARLDVSQNLVSLWERGKGSLPDLREAVALARVFEVSVEYLADDALDEPPDTTRADNERGIVLVYRTLADVLRPEEAAAALNEASRAILARQPARLSPEERLALVRDAGRLVIPPPPSQPPEPPHRRSGPQGRDRE